jgi:hypothetical protein
MDGFEPFSICSSSYFCWQIFMMPYNLPTDKCLKEGFIFLSLVILSPKYLGKNINFFMRLLHPRKSINLFMRTLIKELKGLWQGVDAYDSNLKYRFHLRVSYQWLIHDFLAHVIWVGWCVHDRLCCPICIGDSNAFRLEHVKRSLSLISMEGSFTWITLSRMIHICFWKARQLEKGHQSKN